MNRWLLLQSSLHYAGTSLALYGAYRYLFASLWRQLTWRQLASPDTATQTVCSNCSFLPSALLPTRTLTLMGRALQRTEVGPVTVLPGTIVQITPPLLHFEERFWGPDAREFRPERFRGEWGTGLSRLQGMGIR